MWRSAEPNMEKTFVLDTNVLLHNPNAVFAFEQNNVVIPFAVIEEIDNQKKRQDEIGRNAREISRILDGMRATGSLSEKVRLPNDGTLWIELNHIDTAHLPSGVDPSKHDNRILAVAHALHREGKARVTLVTKDLNLRIKADVLGMRAEDFFNDKVDYHQLYSGVAERDLAPGEFEAFFREKGIESGENGHYPNQFVVLRGHSSPSQSALARHVRGRYRPLVNGEVTCFGIKARNKEQRFALDLLLDDDVRVVTLVGDAGTGKTLLALAVGLEKVLEEKVYGKLLVTRPIVPMGDDLGYLPGSKEEKLRPWMQPIYDNLEFLLCNCADRSGIIEDYMGRDIIQLEALTYIRGRSIPNQFIICDEAQNLSPHMIKTLVTRVGEGTKIVFTGDPEQIDNPYLDASSNGLTYLVEKFKGEELTGHVTLVRGERSKVAELGARLL